MKLYVGAQKYKPDGFKTVDIDDTHSPDIVADVTNMPQIESNSADEVVAGHVLEHIDWPDSFKAIAEFTRVLKIGGKLRISIPDMSSLMRMVLSGDSVFHVMGLIYGVGGRENRFEQHRYGFTAGMIVDILESLGYSDFNWWNSPFGDASNGWVPRYDGDHCAMSLNVSAVKRTEPCVNPADMYEQLVRRPLGDYSAIAADIATQSFDHDLAAAPKLYQRIHYQLIEARQRSFYLEEEVRRRDEEIQALKETKS
ncbi:methyltransferase domain-containing protein [Novosphingobium sp.]|uniref:class I SAM-dependent methyltransferase n=1 Tax=Novosphingobium sp. TaxID=1874826 RepID=UPI0031DBDF7F